MRVAGVAEAAEHDLRAAYRESVALFGRDLQVSEVGEQVPQLATANAYQMVVVPSVGIEARSARAEVELTELTQGNQLVERLVNRLERDGGQLGPHYGIHRLGRGVDEGLGQGREDPLTLRGHLQAAPTKQVTELGRGLHAGSIAAAGLNDKGC